MKAWSRTQLSAIWRRQRPKSTSTPRKDVFSCGHCGVTRVAVSAVVFVIVTAAVVVADAMKSSGFLRRCCEAGIPVLFPRPAVHRKLDKIPSAARTLVNHATASVVRQGGLFGRQVQAISGSFTVVPPCLRLNPSHLGTMQIFVVVG